MPAQRHSPGPDAAAAAKATAAAEALRPQLVPMVAAGYSLRRMSVALAAAVTVAAKGSPLSASTVRLQLQRLGLSRSVVIERAGSH